MLGFNSDSTVVGGALALTLHVSRLLGVAPLRMERTRTGWRISVSRAITLYSYAILGGLHATVIASIAIDMNLEPAHAVFARSTTSRLVGPFQALALIATVTNAVWGASERMGHIIVAKNVLRNVLSSLHVKERAHTSIERKRVVCAFLCILLSAYPACQYLYSFVNEATSEGRSLIVVYLYTAFYLEFIIIIMTELQFVFMAMNVKSTFETVNDKFEELLGIIDKKSLIELQEVIETANAVRQISVSYATVCDAMREVDGCFGSVLLQITGSFILLLVVVPLYLFLNLLNGSSLIDVLLRTGTLMSYLLFITVGCEPGYKTELELDRTRSLTDRLLRRLSLSPNEPLALQVDLLFKQIRFNNVSYSPMGVCTLNRSFINGLLNTTITLTIIVLQYQALDQQNSSD